MRLTHRTLIIKSLRRKPVAKNVSKPAAKTTTKPVNLKAVADKVKKVLPPPNLVAPPVPLVPSDTLHHSIITSPVTPTHNLSTLSTIPLIDMLT